MPKGTKAIQLGDKGARASTLEAKYNDHNQALNGFCLPPTTPIPTAEALPSVELMLVPSVPQFDGSVLELPSNADSYRRHTCQAGC